MVPTLLLTLDPACWICTSGRLGQCSRKPAAGCADMPEPAVAFCSDGIHRTAETRHLIHLTRAHRVTLRVLLESFKPRGPAESVRFYFAGNCHTCKVAAFFFFSCGRNQENFLCNRKLKFNFKIIKTGSEASELPRRDVLWGPLPNIH